MEEREVIEIKERLENIEEILKMLLVNSVLNDSEIEKINLDMVHKFEELLTAYKFSNIRLNYIEKKYYIFADLYEDSSLAEIKKNYSAAMEVLNGMKLVITFEKIHPKRKKALEDAQISYYVSTGVLKIF